MSDQDLIATPNRINPRFANGGEGRLVVARPGQTLDMFNLHSQDNETGWQDLRSARWPLSSRMDIPSPCLFSSERSG